MSGTVFEGQDGSSDTGISDPGNSQTLADTGFVIENITAQPASSVGAMVGEAIMGLLTNLLGAPPAEAAVVSTAYGTTVGYVAINLPAPMSLSLFAKTYNLYFHSDGGIWQVGTGKAMGWMLIPNIGPSSPGLFVYDDVIDGPSDLDSIGFPIGITFNNGTRSVLGGISAATWAQINGFTDSAGNSVSVNRTLPVPIMPGYVVSSTGAPIMDAANFTAMFSKERAFVMPGLVGGRSGISSLRDGGSVVPDPSAGGAGFKFDVGQWADFRVTYLLLSTNAKGMAVLRSSTSEPIQVIDPSTGKLFVPTNYAYVEVHNGSQDIRLWNQPNYGYTGPLPTQAAPLYNTADTVSPVVALSNLNSQIIPVITQAAFLANNPGYNWGGPDGGPD